VEADRAGRAAPPAVRLELLSSFPDVVIRGRRTELSRRHAEILAVLALSSRGLTAERLTIELYGERGKPVTVRAELSRLRRMMEGLLQARPYRLLGDAGGGAVLRGAAGRRSPRASGASLPRAAASALASRRCGTSACRSRGGRRAGA
jgi:hypothetical protein